MEEKKCPCCGGQLECKLTNLTIGRDGGNFLTAAFFNSYDVELYACPKCGKVELYTANFAPKA